MLSLSVKNSIRGLLVVSLFLFSTLTHAEFWYSVSSNNASGYGGSFSEAVSDWCSTIAGSCAAQSLLSDNGSTQQWTVDATGGGFSTSTVTAYENFIGSCANSNKGLIHTWSDNTCHAEPEFPPCPDSGTVKYSKVLVLSIGGSGATHSHNGCEYSVDGATSCWVDLATGDQVCGTKLVSTGNNTVLPDSTLSAPEDTEPAIPPDTSTDTTGNTQDVVVTETPTSTAGDGTTTDVTNTTETTVSGSGTVVDNGDNTITVVDTDGATTVYSENKTVVTHPDGSVTETIQKDTTNSTGTTSTTVIDKSTGAVTNSNNTSLSNDYSQIVVNNYDSAGNLTGSSSVSSGDGTGTGTGTDDETVEGNCGAPDQPSCDVTLSGEENLSDPSVVAEQSGYGSILDGVKSDIEGIDGSATHDGSITVDISQFNLPSTGNCDPSQFETTYKSHTANFATSFCSIYDSSLHSMLRYLFYVLALIFIYKEFFSTLKRTA